MTRAVCRVCGRATDILLAGFRCLPDTPNKSLCILLLLGLESLRSPTSFQQEHVRPRAYLLLYRGMQPPSGAGVQPSVLRFFAPVSRDAYQQQVAIDATEFQQRSLANLVCSTFPLLITHLLTLDQDLTKERVETSKGEKRALAS